MRHRRQSANEAQHTGTLFVVATPIGNLKDITLRAIETLQSVGLIACEDTRRTKRLLSHLGIKVGKPSGVRLLSYFEGNELRRADSILCELRAGTDVALVTDAGTPAVSDPGFLLLKAAIDSQIPIVPVPGASAPIALLSAAGLPTDCFLFEGFLPRKKGKRLKRIEQLNEDPATLVFFESPRRIARTLQELLETLGDRDAVIGRELTKQYEELVRGTLSELLRELSGREVKGEITLAVAGKSRRA